MQGDGGNTGGGYGADDTTGGPKGGLQDSYGGDQTNTDAGGDGTGDGVCSAGQALPMLHSCAGIKLHIPSCHEWLQAMHEV
jgi:hypothetical protein